MNRPSYKYRAKIVKVIDGDTVDAVIDLGFRVQTTQRLRLYGINTPEIHTKDEEERKAGIAAKQFVYNKVMHADAVYITTEKDKQGKYGRYLATIEYLDISYGWTNLNQELIDGGYAKEASYSARFTRGVRGFLGRMFGGKQ